MTSGPEQETQPLVLVVEDDERARRSRTDVFADADCEVVGVPSLGAAMRELSTGPAVDLIMTDINLSPVGGNDKSGIELARYARDRYPDVPIVGYSAYFADGDLGDEVDLFNAFSVKGSMDYRSFDEAIKQWRDLAVRHRLGTQSQSAPIIDSLQADVTELKSQVSELDRAVGQFEQTSVSQDHVVWTVLAVLGAILGLLGILVALSLGIAELLR